MTNNPTISDIADKLTAAQKRALLWLPEDGSARAWEKGAQTPMYCMANWTSGNPEKAVALYAKLCRYSGNGPPTDKSIWGKPLWRATPLGLSVRAYLQEKQGE